MTPSSPLTSSGTRPEPPSPGKGIDIILVAEILGHSVETARRYALPTHQDRQTAIERLTTDE